MYAYISSIHCNFHLNTFGTCHIIAISLPLVRISAISPCSWSGCFNLVFFSFNRPPSLRLRFLRAINHCILRSLSHLCAQKYLPFSLSPLTRCIQWSWLARWLCTNGSCTRKSNSGKSEAKKRAVDRTWDDPSNSPTRSVARIFEYVFF